MPELGTKTIAVGGQLAEVGRVQEELSSFWEAYALPPDIENPVSLALEEVLSNVLRHSVADPDSIDIRVTFQTSPEGFAFEVSDGAAAFDPLDRPDPDIGLPLAQRRPGGLGIFLVKKLADELSYHRRDGRNHLRFFKRFSPVVAGS